MFKISKKNVGVMTCETRGSLDLKIQLYDENFEDVQFGVDEDSGERENPRLSFFRLQIGIYYLRVWSPKDQKGKYRLLVYEGGKTLSGPI